MKRDDSSLTKLQFDRVRKEAERLLLEAGAMGCFPTPIEDILVAAKVEEIPEAVLSPGFLAKMRKKAGGALKRALSKVIGLFDAHARFIFVDRTLHLAKQTFVRLHETGHGFLPWQREIYAVVEDCDQTLAPEIADQFEREANVFATEVLFQLDAFTEEAELMEFSILTPVKLSKKYGASIYSSVRQYVFKNWRACAVLVLDPPEIALGHGFRARRRRFVASTKFVNLFGTPVWPEYFTPDDQIGAMVPLGKRRMSGMRELELVDRNGTTNICAAEAFTQRHQVFILIHAVRTLTTKSAIVSARA